VLSAFFPERAEYRRITKYMNNNEECICPKVTIGQGWFNGEWNEGIEVDPVHHQDTCPKFEDYSNGELVERTEAELAYF